MRLGGSSMYETWWWVALVAVWEVIIYNPILDLESIWRIALPIGALLWATWKVYVKCVRPRRRRRQKQLQLSVGTRDLDV